MRALHHESYLWLVGNGRMVVILLMDKILNYFKYKK